MSTEKMSEQGKETLKEEVPQDNTGSRSKKKPRRKKAGKEEKLLEQLEAARVELQEQKDKFIRLFAEFDNFKKRTSRERLDIIKTAGQDIMVELLPVLDDFDRAARSLDKSNDIQSAKEGFDLIHEKLFKKLEIKGLTSMDSMGKSFDPDLHEAITEIPAGSDEMKGKVVDVIEKGYTLNDKIIRYAKVVVGK